MFFLNTITEIQKEANYGIQSGPVKAPPKARYAELRAAKTQDKDDDDEEDEEEGDDEVLSEASQELDYGDSDEDEDEDDVEVEDEPDLDAIATEATDEEPRRERKRKRKDQYEDLEGDYLTQLQKDEHIEHETKRAKKEEDNDEDEEMDDGEVPVHESLAKGAKSEEADKAGRTVFIANVSTDAISSKSAKRTLMNHLSEALEKDEYPAQKVESIRFRSVAFSTASMPKRAAYITKSLMDATTKSTNAYVVLSTDAAARRLVSKLNGTEVLGRHIRVDSVAHPSPTDHRRCIFVGNLGFVDDETIVKKNSEGEEERKKRNKVPSDIEEGLWRTFLKHGKVENVRVVRDPKTRVGKGFAYVQFYVRTTITTFLTLTILTTVNRTPTTLKLLCFSTESLSLPCSRASSVSLVPRTRARRTRLSNEPEPRPMLLPTPKARLGTTPRRPPNSLLPQVELADSMAAPAPSTLAGEPPTARQTRLCPTASSLLLRLSLKAVEHLPEMPFPRI